MELSAVIAIVRREVLEDVEKVLRETGVAGVSISKVKGYGEYQNFFAADGLTENVRLEIFTRKDKVEAITAAIIRKAHTGSRGDGVITVYSIDKFINIRLRAEAIPDAG